MAFLGYLAPARDALYKDNNPDAAEKLLKPIFEGPIASEEERRAIYELMGLIYRAKKKYKKAFELYVKIDDYYQAGYSSMLGGDFQQMQAYWSTWRMERKDHWSFWLYGLISQQLHVVIQNVNKYPTIFQIRNHIESDIANLIDAGRMDFVDSLLTYIDFLTQLNLESPKFAGRALMHAGQMEKAHKFLIKGQKALPNDPEIYFHLGQFGMAQKQYREARLMLNQCLLISPSYTPAKELLAQIPEA